VLILELVLELGLGFYICTRPRARFKDRFWIMGIFLVKPRARSSVSIRGSVWFKGNFRIWLGLGLRSDLGL
jgi:hypothetical protein